jgi:hypothetical protein
MQLLEITQIVATGTVTPDTSCPRLFNWVDASDKEHIPTSIQKIKIFYILAKNSLDPSKG